ncbi:MULTISPECIES: N-6 DNA methylase [Streptomyces]
MPTLLAMTGSRRRTCCPLRVAPARRLEAGRPRTTVALANGSRSSPRVEPQIRQSMLEADRVAGIVALPPQLFGTTQIPTCL